MTLPCETRNVGSCRVHSARNALSAGDNCSASCGTIAASIVAYNVALGSFDAGASIVAAPRRSTPLPPERIPSPPGVNLQHITVGRAQVRAHALGASINHCDDVSANHCRERPSAPRSRDQLARKRGGVSLKLQSPPTTCELPPPMRHAPARMCQHPLEMRPSPPHKR